MNKIRLYFDTSVFGGIHDVEFKQETEMLLKWLIKTKLLVFIPICVN